MGNRHAIVVLSDGRTWSTIGGASICVITQEELDDLEAERIRCWELNPIFEAGLKGVDKYGRIEYNVEEKW